MCMKLFQIKFDEKYYKLLEAFDNELDQVKIIFDQDKVKYNNM